MLRGITVLAVSLLFSPSTAKSQSAGHPEARLRALGLSLPQPNEPAGNYVRAVRSGNVLFLAGHGECGSITKGKLGHDISVDSAYQSALRVGLCLLATLKAEVGDLGKVTRVIRVLGMVNATPEFTDHPKVVNGCSDLLVAVFGERGRHARSSAGFASLPLGMAVEIEMIVEIAPY